MRRTTHKSAVRVVFWNKSIFLTQRGLVATRESAHALAKNDNSLDPLGCSQGVSGPHIMQPTATLTGRRFKNEKPVHLPMLWTGEQTAKIAWNTAKSRVVP